MKIKVRSCKKDEMITHAKIFYENSFLIDVLKDEGIEVIEKNILF